MKSNKVLLLAVVVLILVFINPSTASVPVAQFKGMPTTGSVPLSVSFTDQSTGPTGWAWFFGDETYTSPWNLMTASAGWAGRRSQCSVALQDSSIVLMGGRAPLDGGIKNDVWRSTDEGATWNLMNASAGWPAREYHTCVAIQDGSILLMGGSGSGIRFNDVWRSIDKGATWTLMNSSAEWTATEGPSSVAMPDGSIVLMGGANQTSSVFYNDVWRSIDKGATWTLMNSSAEWPGRGFFSSVVIPDGSIVLMGGMGQNFAYLNDVWRSTDYGATWTPMTLAAEWSLREEFGSVAMPDGSIVLMGGTAGNDVWRTINNGVTWTQLTANAEWPARYGLSSVAMPDGSIVLMGGEGNAWYNDVWRFQPAGSLAQNPSHTYSKPGIYNVALQVYNFDGFSSTRKTGYITVTPSVEGGSINVISNPSEAQIWIDGNLQGPLTPHTFDGISVGVHTVKVHLDTYIDAENTNVIVTSSQTTPVEFQLTAISSETSGMMFRMSPNRTGDFSSVSGGIIPNGQLKWKYPTNGAIYSSPSLANGVVYIGSDDGYIYAINANVGALKWKYPLGSPGYLSVASSPAVVDGVVYIGSADKNVYALDATTGALKWKYLTGDNVRSSPNVVNGVVYFGSWDNNIYAIDANTGSLKWKYLTGSAVLSSPSIANGILYIGSYDGNLYALDANTGTFKWKYTTGGIYSTPAVVKGVVYVGSKDNNLHALDANTGTFKWKYPTNSWIDASPTVKDDVVYIGSDDGYFYTIETNTGTLKWKDQTGGIIDSPAAIADGVVYFGSYDSNLYALDTNTGSLKWKYPTGSIVYSSPAIVNGVAYFGSVDGNIYAVGNEPVTGSISVSSNPVGAQIWIDGNLQGSVAPYTFDGILAGTHVVKVHFAGYLDAENTNVVVTSGQTTPVNFQLTALPAPIAIKVRIVPNTLNTASKGKFVAFITLPNNYKAADVDAKSVVCEGAPALRLIRIKAFPNKFAAIFNRDKLVNVKPGDKVKLTVTGTINKNGQKVGFSGSDLIKIKSKKGTTKEAIDDVEKMTDETVFNQFNPQ